MTGSLRFEELAAANPHLLDDLEAHARAVQESNERAQLEDRIKVPIASLLGDTVSLEKYQTGFKNQGSRGTCYAFAACAAIEAAYNRKYGVDLDLSEQYAFHLNKAGELYPDYLTTSVQHENNSSYWGFQGSSDIVDKFARAALPDESAAPYLDGPAMDQLKTDTPAAGSLVFETATQEELDAFEFAERLVPTAARIAAKYRVTDFGALPGNPSPDQVEAVLRGGHEVVADVPGHCLLLVGFDHDRRVYMVKNSWGEGAFIELSYDSKDWPILGGRYVIDVGPIEASAQNDAKWVGRWHMDHDGWRGELVIRRTTDYREHQGDPTKLGDYYKDGQRYDVNGVTSQEGQALHFWVADTTDKVQPGAQQGQEFWAYVFSWDPGLAAGSTRWDGSDYGVRLSRGVLEGTPSKGFGPDTWLGSWAMNHDGWQGTLDIRSTQPFAASYTSSDGNVLAVSGGPDGAQPHILRIGVAFDPGSPQQFQLFGHTWENDVFSGVTELGGRAYGVQGHRNAGHVDVHEPIGIPTSIHISDG
jgi:hypothetical protein